MTDEEILALMKLKGDGILRKGITKRLDELFWGWEKDG